MPGSIQLSERAVDAQLMKLALQAMLSELLSANLSTPFMLKMVEGEIWIELFDVGPKDGG